MKRRIWVLILVAALAAGGLYYQRYVWPLGGVSQFETVNDAYWFDQIELELDKDVYSTDTGEITLRVKNNAEDGTLILSSGGHFCNWYLEKQIDGIWRTQRTITKSKSAPRWDLSPRNGDLNSLGPSGVVQWGGKEDFFTFHIDYYYGSPLEMGTYRIVIPECELGSGRNNRYSLAVEFEVK